MWNVNGLLRKLGEIDFLDFLKSYDIVPLSETWLGEKHSEDLSIQSFESIGVFKTKKNWR